MRKLRGRLPKFSIPLVLGLLLLGMLVLALLNQSIFDFAWLVMTLLLGGLVTFLVVAPLLLPIEPTREERSGAYRVFSEYLSGSHPPMTVIRDGRIISQNAAAKAHSSGTALRSERGLLVGDSISIIALRTETGIARIVGPRIDEHGRSQSAVVFTTLEEEIDSIFDLRPQFRIVPIQAQTRDGMSVSVRVIALYTLKGTRARRMRDLAQSTQHWPQPFTWRKASVLSAIHGKRIDFREGKAEKTQWGDRIMAIAVPRLRQLIAQYPIDYLTAPLTAEKHPRFAIRDELVKIVRKELETNDDYTRDSGIQILFMAVTMMTPPDKVTDQRFEAWRREWAKKRVEILGQADAEALLMREQARAQVQGEMTARINDALQEAKASGTNNSDLITLRFLEAMEKMAKDPTTRTLLTLDSLKILKQLREMLTPEQTDGPK